jgi:hypothetical protein
LLDISHELALFKPSQVDVVYHFNPVARQPLLEMARNWLEPGYGPEVLTRLLQDFVRESCSLSTTGLERLSRDSILCY